jgi:hypothetical protein
MRPIWQSSLAAVLSFAIVLAGVIAVLAYFLWPHCDREERVLATDTQGRAVVSVFEACTSFGTTLEESIELKSASGDRKTIFKYEPNGGMAGCKGKSFPPVAEPSVDWSNPRVIHISISVVSSIFQKLDALDGIHVTYEIGPVLSDVCGFAKT